LYLFVRGNLNTLYLAIVNEFQSEFTATTMPTCCLAEFLKNGFP